MQTARFAEDDIQGRVSLALTMTQTLEEMLETEFEHLKVQNLDAFEKIQHPKQELLRELTQLTGVTNAHTANDLGPEWDEFRSRMARCRNLHRRNEILISRKVDAIRGALQSLRIIDPASSVEVYDRLGRISRSRRGRSFASV